MSRRASRLYELQLQPQEFSTSAVTVQNTQKANFFIHRY